MVFGNGVPAVQYRAVKRYEASICGETCRKANGIASPPRISDVSNREIYVALRPGVVVVVHTPGPQIRERSHYGLPGW